MASNPKTMEACSIEGCERKFRSRGMCSTHYMRWSKYGDPLFVKAKPERDDSHLWRGDEAGYSGVHARARKVLPRQCAACGATEKLHVALRHDADPANIRKFQPPTGKRRELDYSVKTTDYIRLCYLCHRRYDSTNQGPRAAIIEAITR